MPFPRRWSSVAPLTPAWSTWTLNVCSPVWVCGCCSGCLALCCWSGGSSSPQTNSGGSHTSHRFAHPLKACTLPLLHNSSYKIIVPCVLCNNEDISWKNQGCFHYESVRSVGGLDPHFSKINSRQPQFYSGNMPERYFWGLAAGCCRHCAGGQFVCSAGESQWESDSVVTLVEERNAKPSDI